VNIASIVNTKMTNKPQGVSGGRGGLADRKGRENEKSLFAAHTQSKLKSRMYGVEYGMQFDIKCKKRRLV